MECCQLLRRAAFVLFLPTILGGPCQCNTHIDRVIRRPAISIGLPAMSARHEGADGHRLSTADSRHHFFARLESATFTFQPTGNSLALSTCAELLSAHGEVLWPAATPSNSRLLVPKQDVEKAVALVVSEHDKYGEASIRHVADARNKLTEFARQSLPSLKARDKTAADQLERFIVELQKTLATLTVNY